ncbi:hypothetical protein [Salinarimonas soli]|uniref:Uncharacterized protein n=1 Tax=Salinarimonas soli TaxID=1638099 RepID=A0A5B2VCN8_9HYPH|nr:hypothetical protein [Salinarimonas soli]KAA2236754.1 hypothetical protein F0L46_13375 [Salinarimonas soli]
MKFSFQPGRARRPLRSEQATFRVARLWAHEANGSTEVSHLIDRTYDYASPRELLWHLAERFARPVGDLALDRV